MSTPVILCLMLTLIATVAKYKMWQHMVREKVELAELETESRKVGGHRRLVEDELERVQLRERELRSEIQAISDRLEEVQVQMRQVKEVSKKRIERELITRN